MNVNLGRSAGVGHVTITTKFITTLLCPAAASSNGNGEFGDWNAFSANPPASSSSGPAQPVTDLFGSAQSPTAPTANPALVPPSAELFDLMGGVNHQLTNPHTTLSASQSMTFSLGGATPGASVAMPTMPLSRSQQVDILEYTNMYVLLLYRNCSSSYFSSSVIF